jgi:hypothetical protein
MDGVSTAYILDGVPAGAGDAAEVGRTGVRVGVGMDEEDAGLSVGLAEAARAWTAPVFAAMASSRTLRAFSSWRLVD